MMFINSLVVVVIRIIVDTKTKRNLLHKSEYVHKLLTHYLHA